jgi:hypothetical protein
MTIARKLIWSYILQMVPGRSLVLKKALVDLALEQSTLCIWLFITKITDQFILGLEILRAYDTVTDLKHSVLQMGQEEVLLWHSHAWPQPSLYMMASNDVIPVQCDKSLLSNWKASGSAHRLMR